MQKYSFMSRYKIITQEDLREVYLSGIELIELGYAELPETNSQQANQLVIDTTKMLFFFTDAKGIQVVRNAYQVEETNLNQIKSWQNKPKKAKA